VSKNLTWRLIALLLVVSVLVTACGATAEPTKAPEPTKAAEATKAPEPTAVPEVKDLVTWYQFDQDNEDPANDEAVGNAYLRDTIPLFDEAFAGKWNWINVPKAWDKMAAELVAAVQAGGDVPDIINVGTQYLPDLFRNGVFQDIGDWAKQQAWWGDMDPAAIEACTGPDGKLYCIAPAQIIFVTFVWADRFPNGYPKTPEEFMVEAERLKAEGIYAMTYFGSTDYGGSATTRALWMIISGFGGTYDDGQGNMLLNTPENVAAIEWLREVVAKGYVPEVAFAGGFAEEEPMKDATAASIPTGMFGYRYIRPLTAPNGNKYTTETEQDMLNAIDAGDIILAPFVAPEGHKPGCGLSVQTLGIPVGAKNVEGAYDYINWIMSNPEIDADWVNRAAAGFPALKSTRSQAQFQSEFYKQLAAASDASACRTWFGSLTRPDDATVAIANVVYKLVKEDPTADIATELQKTQDEYNANN
jgi:multiple sugar transport system substrate-binding protein